MLNLSESMQGDVMLLEVGGRLDVASSHEMTEKLSAVFQGGHKKLILDLAGLDYISSAGLRSLLMGAKAAKASGGKIIVSSLKDYIKEVFDISGFSGLFDVCADRAAALAALAH